MTDHFFGTLLVVGGVCIGLALHAADLAVRTRERRHVSLTLIALIAAAYCLVACRYFSLTDGNAARAWGQSLCAFTPYITFLFGELTLDLAESRPPWLVRLQKANIVVTTLFTCGVLIDIFRGTSIVVLPDVATDLASLHRHRLSFTPLGMAYGGWIASVFMTFAALLFGRYKARRELFPMVLGCLICSLATLFDFAILVRARDGIFIQYFGIFALVVGCWRVFSNRFEDAVRDTEDAVTRLEDQRSLILVAAPLLHNQKLASLGTLAAGVAHEINNPIQGIMNYATLLKRQLDPSSCASDFADEIAGESKRAADIVRSLLRFGRADGAMTVAASIEEIVAGTLVLMRGGLDHKGITLRVNIERELPEVNCRAAQLQQVIMNLVTNARDAILARDADRKDERLIVIDVSQRIRSGEPWLHVEVSDTGVGVDPRLADCIFDPFFTTKGDGTGLGLAVSHGIIESHGGDITFESEPGRGSRFRIQIPCRMSMVGEVDFGSWVASRSSRTSRRKPGSGTHVWLDRTLRRATVGSRASSTTR